MEDKLKKRYNYYLKRMKERTIEEAGFRTVIEGKKVIEKPPVSFLFKSYEELYEKGVTRKIGNQTVRYLGERAIEVEIESYKRLSKKSYFKNLYIENYTKSLEQVGISPDVRRKVANLLRRTSTDKLTYLLRRGKLPEIQYVYAQIETEEDLYSRIKSALKYGISNEDIRAMRMESKELTETHIKGIAKQLNWFNERS